MLVQYTLLFNHIGWHFQRMYAFIFITGCAHTPYLDAALLVDCEDITRAAREREEELSVHG